LDYYNSESKWLRHGAGRECDKENVILDGTDGTCPAQKL